MSRSKYKGTVVIGTTDPQRSDSLGTAGAHARNEDRRMQAEKLLRAVRQKKIETLKISNGAKVFQCDGPAGVLESITVRQNADGVTVVLFSGYGDPDSRQAAVFSLNVVDLDRFMDLLQRVR